MKIDELDGRMRAFEAILDPTVLPGVFMIARLDGRNFTRLTKEIHPFEVPFDRRFHEYMLRTAEHLMAGCGVKVAFAYTQSDERSRRRQRGRSPRGFLPSAGAAGRTRRSAC
jgi:tRNA(His) guanylyltransferase